METICLQIVDFKSLLKYFELIESARSPEYNKEKIYTEIHHIIPKCLGGSLDKSNEIILIYPDHVRAHIYLAKATKHWKLCCACSFMTQQKEGWENLTNFELEELNNYKRNYFNSEETKKKKSLSRIGKDSPMKGKKMSTEAKNKISMANKGKKRTKEEKQKMSKSHKGKILSKKHKENISKAFKGSNHPLYISDLILWYNKIENYYIKTTLYDFKNKYKIPSTVASGLKNGKRYSYKGWVCLCSI